MNLTNSTNRKASHHMNARKLTMVGLAVSVAGLILSGCSAGAAPAPSTTSLPAGDTVTVTDAWVKSADSGMTAGFGLITNPDADTDATVVAVTTPAAPVAELHETVEDETGTMVMRPIEGGFTIPAGGDFPLSPAGNHLMLMEISEPLTAGAEVPFTLEFSDGSTLDFTAVVKDYSGANENYVGDDSGGMDMGDGDE
jgi:copper(I)-binding protein